MASRATYPFGDVNAVVEIRVLWQVMYSLPFYWLILTEALLHKLKIRTVRPDLAVAIHARLRGWHPGCCRGFDCRMAISAIDPIIAYVVLVTELNGLLFLYVTTRKVRRASDLSVGVKCGAREYDHQNHTDPGNVVRAFIENLSHARNFFELRRALIEEISDE